MQKIDSNDIISNLARVFFNHLRYEELLKILKSTKQNNSQLLQAKGFSHVNLVLGGGYNVDFLAPIIQVIGLSRRIVFNLEVWPYEVFKSRILSDFKSEQMKRPDFFYYCGGGKFVSLENLSDELNVWLTMAKKIRDQYSADVIFNNLAALDSQSAQDQEAIAHFNRELSARLPLSAKLLDVEALSRQIGKDKWNDERFFELTKCITTLDNQCILAKKLVSQIASFFGLNARAVILDLDNVLWGGELGDLGWQDIHLTDERPPGQEFSRFQDYLLSLKSRGILLCICSQNELSNVEEVFKLNTNMKLKLSDFAVIECDWSPKSQKVQRILLKLNLDSSLVAFVDDNPFEREQIRFAFKNMVVPELPSEVSQFSETIETTGFFDTNFTTSEDDNRNQMKRADILRDEALAASYSYEDYLKDLKIEAEVKRFTQDDLARVNQLINKTNQFNLNKKPTTLAWLENISKDSHFICLSLRMKDRLGDLGLISSIIIRHNSFGENPEAFIESWVLSCRAFGRNAESIILNSALEILSKLKVSCLDLEYLPTEKNKLMVDIFLKLGFKRDVKRITGQYFSLEIL